MSDYYTYIFIRQDLSIEQQIIQASHATLKLGKEMRTDTMPNFVLIGVRNLEGLLNLEAILERFYYKYVTFHEPDMDSEMTAIATHPVHDIERGVLLAFTTLKIKR